MNIIDIIIICGLALGAITGFIRGFLKETVIFLGTISAVILAFILKNPVSQIMYSNLPFLKLGGFSSVNIILYEIVAFVLTLIVLLVIVAIISKITGIIEKILKSTILLALPSKLLGMVVGAIQSVVIIYVILFILSFPILNITVINESKAANLILEHTPIISNITDSFITSCKEISKYTLSSVDLKDSTGTNTKIVEILLKNKLVTADNIKLLIDNDKIKINDADALLEKYKEV